MNEFLLALDIEKTPLAIEIFSEMDRSNDGHITFREFTLSIWKYCSRGPDSIWDFAFDIYDTDDSNELTREEIQEMIVEAFGKTSSKHDVGEIMSKFDNDRNSKISRKEFKKILKAHPKLLKPALAFQKKLKDLIGDEEFWKEIMKVSDNVSTLPEVQKLFKQKRRKRNVLKEQIEAEHHFYEEVKNSGKDKTHFELHGFHDKHHKALYSDVKGHEHDVVKSKSKSRDGAQKKTNMYYHEDIEP
eukprot:CAMPEP_0185034454 /NCGR_PEP_ID=MMETSP1103-20130426/24373_1 /TAXON_ID=36769 /ORGANISM="Paraphysomonas bandaiensis, Strain Caron Lab Isolate" /LENGTH=243 /DNA_ID=CAMNT_0027571121 /DNA_START=186 /DNA_END=917 /DNA_ORIENTATION=-